MVLNEMYKMLYDAVEKLSPQEKEIFHESFILGKKGKDVAEQMGVSTKTVERYRKRILDFLRTEMKDNLPLIALITILAS